MPPSEVPVVVLVGAPGAGKTTVGRILALRLGVPFFDTDELVADSAGVPIDELMVDFGEQRFRVLEAEACQSALDTRAGVIALGGGALDASPDVAGRLRAGRLRAGSPSVVWLRVGAATAAARMGLHAPRQVLLGNVRGTWAQQLAHRDAGYAAVADLVIDADDAEPAQVADEVLASLVRRRSEGESRQP